MKLFAELFILAYAILGVWVVVNIIYILLGYHIKNMIEKNRERERDSRCGVFGTDTYVKYKIGTGRKNIISSVSTYSF